jgi:hypothetical protein
VRACVADAAHRTPLGRHPLAGRPGRLELLAWIGYIHWVLWQSEGYKFIPAIGPG